MTFRGFIIRLVLTALFTWVVGSIVESFGWALYFALSLIGFHEAVRPRPLLHVPKINKDTSNHEPNDPVSDLRVDRNPRAVVHNPERPPVANPDRSGGIHPAGPDRDPQEGLNQPTTMPYPRSYQPELHPHLIKGLHHEAKLRGVPMTVLLRDIVTAALEPTEGMQIARKELRKAGDKYPAVH
jgi:hypothetical protein